MFEVIPTSVRCEFTAAFPSLFWSGCSVKNQILIPAPKRRKISLSVLCAVRACVRVCVCVCARACARHNAVADLAENLEELRLSLTCDLCIMAQSFLSSDDITAMI
jgi:hypothetical protein